jgi:hypothetical protein
MTGTYKYLLEQHKPLGDRRQKSIAKLNDVRRSIKTYLELKQPGICVFAAGSYGRLEVGANSDLDVFAVWDDEQKPPSSRLIAYSVFGRLIQVNESLELPPFSGDGKFLAVHDFSSLCRHAGQPKDDLDNTFTTRMLFLLESQWLNNESIYAALRTKIVEHYFRDSVGKKSFRPLFLLNDVLRYWRTLCLNYEDIRNDNNRPW